MIVIVPMYPILDNLPAILARQRRKGRRGGTGDPDSPSGWDWGWRVHPIDKTRKWHNGVDLSEAGILGKPIFSPWPGVVADAWYDDSPNGYALRISHPTIPGIRETAYAHLQRHGPGIKDGVEVEAGQIVGYVGSTGKSTGPHLHFIVKADEKRSAGGRMRRDIDPLPFLEAQKKSLLAVGGSLLAFVLLLTWLGD